MVYKFNLAGSGSPEIEMRGPRFWSGKYELYHDGKLLEKTGPSAKRKLIKMPEGNSFYIVLSPYRPYIIYYPPQILIDNEIVFEPPKPKFYEIIYHFLNFLMMISLLNFVNGGTKLPLSSHIVANIIAVLLFIPFMLAIAHYYAKVRINLRPIARLGLLIFNLALLISFVTAAAAIMKMIYK